ncbi:MAG: transposase, partial [Ignavibacteria bacterium]|nr:transposase [Ignavibacteria bacterium]
MPIVKPENMGIHMAVDEKYINGSFYTLLTNGDTGKIALMAATTKASQLAKAMTTFADKLFEVKIFTRDLAANYDWFGREQFMNAAHVADKFHVLKNGFDALQDLRIYYRQK